MAAPDPTRPENAGVLRYLARTGAAGEDPSPDDADRYRLGTHPDIVNHLWDVLAAACEGDARSIVHGTPALVDPRTGVLMALGLGTTYALRLAAPDAAGAKTVHEYRTVGRTLDLGVEFGPGWVFGAWDEDEVARLRRSAALL